MPVSLDSQFEEKSSILQRLALQFKVDLIVPIAESQSSEFDFYHLMNQFHHSDVVIADLSFERPSCYYELGIAEALGKDVQLIAVTGTKIHQTSLKSHVHYYKNINDYETYLSTLIRRYTA